MFEDYMSELNSEMSNEQADSLDERYRTGLEAIHDLQDDDEADFSGSSHDNNGNEYPDTDR